MQTQRQRRIREVFDGASGQPADAQLEFVRRECRGEPDVEEAVLRLLGAGRKSGGFLEQPIRPRGEPALREGVRIGSYRVIRELGAGGMGIVYLAERADDTFHRVTAVKVIRPEYKSGALVRRFEQEREILARLDHPNIARIVDGGTTAEGLPYFVMDYVNGVPIDTFCQQHNANLQQRLNLFRQACSAVHYLHANRTVHRDLKPANILVTNEGMVKLVDFGIAKVLDENKGEARPATVPLMTPGYASPEQLRGGVTSAATDIYSLGAVLYELLTGVRPHDFGESPTPEIIRVVSHEEPIKPSTRVVTGPLGPQKSQEFRVRLKGDLDCIALMALRKEPERRYATAQDFGADIERYQLRQPIVARKTSAVYTTSKFFERQRKAVVATLLIAALLSGATWEAAKYHYQRELQQLQQSQQRLISKEEERQGRPANIGEIHDDLEQFAQNYGGSFQDLRLVPDDKRQELVEQGLQYLQQVAPQAVGNQGTAEALALAYLTIAQAQRAHDPMGALATCETGLNALGPALASFPQSSALTALAERLGELLRTLAAQGQGTPN